MAQNPPAFLLLSDAYCQGLQQQVEQALNAGYILYGTHSAMYDGNRRYWTQSLVLPEYHPDTLINPELRRNRGGNKSSKQRKSSNKNKV